MTTQWDRFADTASRTLDALGYEDNVEVYQPAETYEAGEGYSIEYPDAPTATIDGALDTPSSDSDKDAGGTTESVDLTIGVRKTMNIAWNDAGDSGEAKTGVEVEGTQYVVDTIDDQYDGLLELSCDEVDQWP